MWLPPNHSQFNTIEPIWAHVKGKVANKNKLFTINEAERLFREALSEVNTED